MMSYIEMFGKDAHKTLHVTYRSYQQKKLNQTRHVSFLIGGMREKICAKKRKLSDIIYILIWVSLFGRRALDDFVWYIDTWDICPILSISPPSRPQNSVHLLEVFSPNEELPLSGSFGA